MNNTRPGTGVPAGTEIVVRLVKEGGRRVEYPAVVRRDDGTHVVVEARWSEPAARDLGFVVFEPGDLFVEHFWRDRWYSIKEVRGREGGLKGWWCDASRPIVASGGVLVSEDLYLDLWCSADGTTVLRLDEDELERSDLERRDPGAAAEARRALDELERLAGERFTPVLG